VCKECSGREHSGTGRHMNARKADTPVCTVCVAALESPTSRAVYAVDHVGADARHRVFCG
jgi:hypothetical protein